ncbi:MAG: hypothetical protein QM718_04320 [Steroidobacteraceae bacterium]
MNQRAWAIAAIVIAAIAALLFWLASKTYWEQVTSRGLPSGEALLNPLFAQQRLAQELGAQATVLPDLAALPPRGTVLMLYSWSWGERPRRDEELRDWVEQGGALVVDRSGDFDAAFARWSGLKLRKLADDALKRARRAADRDPDDGPCQILHVKLADPPLLQSRPSWKLCDAPFDSFLEIGNTPRLILSDELGPQLVRVMLGRGSVTLLNSNAFDYRSISEHDQARLLVLATGLGPGTRLDFLRGDLAMPSLLALLWRWAAAALVLLLVAAALAAWRAAQRLGPLLPAPLPARRSLRTQLGGMALFLRRYGGAELLWRAMRQALERAADRRLPRAAIDAAERWRLTAELGGADPQLLDALLRDGAAPPAAETLPQSLALLETVRRRLLSTADHRGSA